MPYKEVNGSMACWALKVSDDRLIKILDIRSMITGDKAGYMDVTVQSSLSSELSTSVLGGNLVFTSGSDHRNIKVRVVSANKTVFPEIPFTPRRQIEGHKRTNTSIFRIVKAFQHHDSITITPNETLYVKLPVFMDGYTVSADLVQKPLPASINLDYQTRQKINPSCVWYPTGFPLVMNRAVVLRNLDKINPVWDAILKEIKDKKHAIHIADLVFQGVSNDDVVVDSPFGEIKQSVQVTKVIHIMLAPSQELPVGKQICTLDPMDNTRIPAEPGDEIVVSLSKVGETEWDWPWYYLDNNNKGVEFLRLEKKNRAYLMVLKVKHRPPEGQTTVTFGYTEGSGECHRRSVHVIFGK